VMIASCLSSSLVIDFLRETLMWTWIRVGCEVDVGTWVEDCEASVWGGLEEWGVG